MKMILEGLSQSGFGQAIAFALRHSLWQASLAALLLLLVIACTKSPRVRYVAGCVALAMTVAGFLLTFFYNWQPGGFAQPWQSVAVQTSPRTGSAFGFDDDFRRVAVPAWVVPLWMLGVIALQVRTLAGWLAARRLAGRGVCLAAAQWQRTFGQLAQRMRVRQCVTLLESALAHTPMVIGYLRPVVLVPAGLLAAMPPDQVEAILLHELAHIRRHDYLVNLLQSVAEGLLFYHPAVWWISKSIRTEREHCCDDLAIETSSHGTLGYATALLALEQSRWGNPAQQPPALAATGGNLMNRLQRLLQPQPELRLRTAWTLLPLTLVLGGLLTAWQTPTPLPKAYDIWLNQDVAYIIKPEEKAAFLRMRTDEEREQFIVQFWKRLDPTPETPNQNERKEEHYRRIRYANERFRHPSVAGWSTDRGRMYIVFGPPDEIESHPAGRNGGPPFEKWRYWVIQGVGKDVFMEFIDSGRNGVYQMTKDPNASPAKRFVAK